MWLQRTPACSIRHCKVCVGENFAAARERERGEFFPPAAKVISARCEMRAANHCSCGREGGWMGGGALRIRSGAQRVTINAAAALNLGIRRERSAHANYIDRRRWRLIAAEINWRASQNSQSHYGISAEGAWTRNGETLNLILFNGLVL